MLLETRNGLNFLKLKKFIVFVHSNCIAAAMKIERTVQDKTKAVRG